MFYIILYYLVKSGAFSSGDLVLTCIALIQNKITSKEEDMEQIDVIIFCANLHHLNIYIYIFTSFS